ncbi:ubiquitin domain-containing protein UBFD1 isoform X2 [Tachyglossus aculeatus]|uniref:ubiquitin domain-containing protein UBFD1 isoform X2 n=1 Tax=Tachyglossus aculeatus TaxID=9261 RepID=UPI0018F786C4|nr:ubiquitin domain-containing protein UBFD1 isoform X2 [Tachyglossus aculeatus]
MAAAAGAPDDVEEAGMETDNPKLQLNCVETGEENPVLSKSAVPADQAQGDTASAQASVSNGDEAEAGKELVDLKIIWNKNKYDVKFPLDNTGAELKQKIHSITGLPPAMQKVMFKGLLPEEKTLREIKVTSGAKIMVVGSTINDVLAVNTPKDSAQQESKSEENKKEPLCRQKERLPTVPLSGMYNKTGGKVRLTFKLEQDQLWIGTKERTEKLPMGSIKNVVSEPIEGHEDYHMMAFQLGPTEASYYWVYWVPTQYVDAIKDTVLGKWQYF